MAAVTGTQVLQLAPELEQLAGGEEDGGQRLHHHPRELEVLLQHEQLRHAAVDVLAAEEDAQLPDDEGSLVLQQVLVDTEQLQQAQHELLEVRGRVGGGVDSPSLGGGDLCQHLEVEDDDLVRGVGERLEEDREELAVVDILEHLHGDLYEEVVDPPERGHLGGHRALLQLLGQHLHHGGEVQLLCPSLLLASILTT